VRPFSFIAALFVLVGCATKPSWLISEETDKAVTDSLSFRRAWAISPNRVRWFVDGIDGTTNPVVYIGYDMGTHYTRSATLRVREGHIIEREEMRDDGELVWVPDR
jgi:hypothetical protein